MRFAHAIFVITTILCAPAFAANKVCEKLLSNAKAKGPFELVEFATANDLDGYLYSGYQGRPTPVISQKKQALDSFVEEYGDDTIGFISRPDFWHAYLRVGKVLIDIDVDVRVNRETGRSAMGGRFRDYKKVMLSSSSTKWKEGILQLDAKTIEMIQWFFLYRYALIEQMSEQKMLGTAWDRQFKEMFVADSGSQENCVGFVMSAFMPSFIENPLTKSEAAALKSYLQKKKIQKSLPFAKQGAIPDLNVVLAHLRKAAKKYSLDGFDPVDLKSPKGLMRLANIHPQLIGFVASNMVKSNFKSQNKMGFAAMKSTGKPIDLGLDEKVSERVDIEELQR